MILLLMMERVVNRERSLRKKESGRRYHSQMEISVPEPVKGFKVDVIYKFFSGYKRVLFNIDMF